MLLIILTLIFLRPFISSLAFPYLNLVYSQVLLVSLGTFIVYKKVPFLKIKTLGWPFGLFFIMLGISIIFSQNKLNSFAEIYKYTTGLFMLLAGAALSENDRKKLVQVIIFSGLAVSFIAIYQYFFGFKHLSDYLKNNNLLIPSAVDYIQRKRVFMPFLTPNALGGYLAMIIMLALINQRKILILPMLLALLFTKSLGALFSLLAGLVVLRCLSGRFRKKDIYFISGLFLLTVVIFVLRNTTPKGHLAPIFSTMMRLNYWQEALKIIIQHPFFGVGPGNFNSALSRYAHNAYLQIWSETGIAGLLSFIWIICAVLKSCLKQLKNPPNQAQLAGLIAVITVFLIHNCFDFTFFLLEVAYLWWIILGLIVT